MASLKEQSEELFNLGLQYSENGQFENAIECYDKIINLNPNFAMAYVFRGKCQQELKEYDFALYDYDEAIRLANNSGAIELNLDFSDIYYNIGICCEESQDYLLLTPSEYKEIVEGELVDPALAGYERREIRSEMLERALDAYSKAIKLNPSYAEVYNNRGNCYIELDILKFRHIKLNRELALADYNEAIKLNPSYAEAYNNRGIYYQYLGEYKRALDDYDKAIDFNSNYIEAYLNRGECYASMPDEELTTLPNIEPFFFSKDIFISNYFREIRYVLSSSSKRIEESCIYAISFVATKQYDHAKNCIEGVFKNAPSKEQHHKAVYLKNIKNAEELDIKNKDLEKLNTELEEKNQQLQAKEKELEDMMSMFAHKFRSPLDAIIYNTTHENQIKLYTESAQTMRGLLDIFSIISSDDKILIDKIKNDNKGNATLMSVLNKNLNMTLLHLLSVSGMSKIHQHYMNYAKAQGKITDDVSYKEWCDDYFEMEGELQKQWEQEFSALLNQSASLAERLQWLEHYFFKLDIIGFEIESIQFKEYETTESFLFILMNEILVNAFKYYASENKQPVVLEWTATEDYQVLSCRNPSIRRERDQHKGSGKGHTFLSALARKTGCKFTKPKPQDDFLLEFAIPNQLLLSNSGTEK